MNILMKTIFVILITLIPSMAAHHAHAQGIFGANQIQKPQETPEIQFVYNNDYMSSILQLQNQVALLEKMIDRQEELNQIAENFSDIGVPFEMPAPEYDICKQLPGNDVCAEFYADLYQDYVLSSARLPQLMPPLDLPKTSKASAPVVEDVSVSDFVWSEITCLNQACKAVIAPTYGDDMTRQTVYVGDQLPNGLIVEDISLGGMFASNGSKIIEIKPAPSSYSPEKNIL